MNIDKIIQEIKDKAHICMQDAYNMGVQDERERIAKLLNVQKDEDGNLYIDLTEQLKKSLGLDNKDGTKYTTGTNLPTYQDMADMAERHAEIVANYVPSGCAACDVHRFGGIVHIDLHTCEYAEKHKRLQNKNIT